MLKNKTVMEGIGVVLGISMAVAFIALLVYLAIPAVHHAFFVAYLFWFQ